MKVDNGTAGRQPTVTFTVKDKSGAAVPLNQLNNVSLLMAGPTSDYGYTSFGSDVTTPGYVSESATGAQCNTAGTCTYTFQHAIPADAKGSFAIGIESRRTETLLAGTTDANGRAVRSGEQGVLFLSRWIGCAAAANGGSNGFLQSVPYLALLPRR